LLVGIRQRRTVGAILKVPLDGESHAYAWTLPEADFAFFDLRANSDVAIEDVIRRLVAFRVGVHKSAWTTGRWPRVGKVEPPPRLLAAQPKFMQDSFNGRLSIYLGGDIRPATHDECIGLERCAVWGPEHVEDRLRDHFKGITNIWVQSLALDNLSGKVSNPSA
jgi:hypothetical protein